MGSRERPPRSSGTRLPCSRTTRQLEERMAGCTGDFLALDRAMLAGVFR